MHQCLVCAKFFPPKFFYQRRGHSVLQPPVWIVHIERVGDEREKAAERLGGMGGGGMLAQLGRCWVDDRKRLKCAGLEDLDMGIEAKDDAVGARVVPGKPGRGECGQWQWQ